MNVNFCVVQIRNTTNKSINISKNKRLNTFQKYEKKNCYLINSKHHYFVVENWIKKIMKLEITALIVFQNATFLSTIVNSSIVIDFFNFNNDIAVVFVFIINIDQKYTTSIDIIIYNTKFFVAVLIKVIEFYFNFWKKKNDFIVNFSFDEWMFITLQLNVIVQSFKVYSINQTNKNFIDKKFDKLQAQNELKYII